MKDIHEVLRQKQAKFAQLGKQIEMLQQAAEKLREVAPLLAETDDEYDEFWRKATKSRASRNHVGQGGGGEPTGGLEIGTAFGSALALICFM